MSNTGLRAGHFVNYYNCEIVTLKNLTGIFSQINLMLLQVLTFSSFHCFIISIFKVFTQIFLFLNMSHVNAINTCNRNEYIKKGEIL